MGSSLPLVASSIHLLTFGSLALAQCLAHSRCSEKPQKMNERDGLTLNGLSGDAFHDAIVITVQKTGLKTMFSRGWKSLMFGPVGAVSVDRKYISPTQILGFYICTLALRNSSYFWLFLKVEFETWHLSKEAYLIAKKKIELHWI